MIDLDEKTFGLLTAYLNLNGYYLNEKHSTDKTVLFEKDGNLLYITHSDGRHSVILQKIGFMSVDTVNSLTGNIDVHTIESMLNWMSL